MGVIDEVKQKADIVEVISQYATLKKAGRNFSALCPFHSEKRPSFLVYPEQQSWHCFGACNSGGDVFSFIMKRENMDFGEALRLLGQRTGITIPSKFEAETKKDENERLYQANETAAQYFHNLLLNSPAGEKARNYLDSRGLSLKTISDFQLGFSLNSWEALKQYLLEKGYTNGERLAAGLVVATDDGETHDRFRNRLMFPIHDTRGRVTGFGARVLDDSLPKYLNSPQTPTFDKSSSLYGINLATPAIKQQNLVVIVEGYLDVIIAHQYGFSNVIAAMGTAVSEKQISALKKLTRRMVLALDADAAGEEAMFRCVDYENSFDAEVKVIVLPKGKDPDDVIKEEATMWQYLVAEALPVVDYAFNMVTAGLDLTTTKDKTLATGKLLPIIAKIQDDLRRDHYLTKLSKLTGTTYKSLEAALAAYLVKKKVRKVAAKPSTPPKQVIFSRPLEEYCLALLLRHPELKEKSQSLRPDYFENSQNREIFSRWQQASDLPTLRDGLDSVIGEHLDTLINKDIPANQIESRYADCLLNLRQRFLQNLEARKAEVLALEAADGGAAAGLAKLEAEGIEPAIQLREVFQEKARRGQPQRR